MNEEKEACSQFEPHPVRKFCKECRRHKADHPMTEEDAEIIKGNLNVFSDQPKAISHAQYAWTPAGCPINRLDAYFSKFQEDKVPRHNSEGQKNRLKRLTYQIPLSDISLENCRFVEQGSKSEVENFMHHLQTSVIRTAEVKEYAIGMAVQCPKCLIILEPDELVVSTSGESGPAYHPACFICFQCRDHIADLIYCSDVNGVVFCLRHYNENNKKRCHACDELIFSTQYALAGEKFYHKNHLLCFSCDRPLEGNKGLEKDGELHCTSCYEDRFCVDCIQCHQKITVQDRHVAYKDKNWHYDCFTCVQCNALLSDSPFEIVDEKFLCMECYNKEHAPRCAGCQEIFDLQAKVVKYEDKIYHVPCFKCIDCQASIGTGSFVPHEGKIYCKNCHLSNFSVKCFRCKHSITDEHGVMYDKKPYHEDCFTCYKCSTKIANKPFKNVSDNWYCTNCYADTFCKKCHSCGEPILLGADQDILYSYQDYQWHANCFICFVCKNSLANTPFAIRENTLVCKTCLSQSSEKSDDKQDEVIEQAEEQQEKNTVTG